ncbi:ornithine cyclodeaminase family protein [Parasphingopyxis algicola]|uniref:ornithine cyclodeaminase family protein n=1 Tax=Parasphingopyxis algicola TaxID=2026624 RepID=UPI0015A0CEE6|nr:ornithine cyclodeaminase family protein [Parasphingopyxis algicola]QLC26354.1 ornithine cyclodeaminase family protein [Parasphingopyxis algicola]
MRIIDRKGVATILSFPHCIAALRQAMAAVSRGEATLPLRQFMGVPGVEGKLAMMPGAMTDPACFGLKLLSKYDREPGDQLPQLIGAYLLFDSSSGQLLAILDGAELTARRAAAASALATDLLARKDARKLAILGNGNQAKLHIEAIAAIRPIDEVCVWGRNADRVNAFVNDQQERTGVATRAFGSVEECIEEADIVCTTTGAKTPILPGLALPDGVHVNLMGASTAAARETDDETVKRSRFYVDYRQAALSAAGELIDAIEQGVVGEEHIAGEIGDVINGQAEGRISDADITAFKALGIAAQDLAVAYRVFEGARDEDYGIDVAWGV